MEKKKSYAAVSVLLLLGIVLVVGLGKGVLAGESLSNSGVDSWNYLPVVIQEAIPPTATATPTSELPTATSTSTPGSGTPTATATSTPGPGTPTTTATPTVTASPDPTLPPPDAFVVDHRSIDDFERIPEQYLSAAANLDMIFIDRSVGDNISDGLTCLSYPSSDDAPNHCVRYTHVDPAFSVDPAEVSWNRPGGYNRENWLYQFWEGGCGEWHTKVTCFMNMVDPVMQQYDVLSFQFSYLSVDESSTIADQPGGFFWDNADRPDVYDLQAYEAQYPDKVFIYWTTSLSRGIGTTVSEAFNNQMRQYAVANDKVLFDVADILSHDPDGNPCYDNRDGVPYDNGNNVENHPDDGQQIPAICQHYTTETDGGHLGSVSAGKIRVAKAFWVLMARIAGWDASTD